jgi:hypothetical protein
MGDFRLTSRIERVRNAVRVGISTFVLILLVTIVLGLVWTSHHQAPPLRTASHLVLSLAGAAGIFALAKIWRTESPRGSARP